MVYVTFLESGLIARMSAADGKRIKGDVCMKRKAVKKSVPKMPGYAEYRTAVLEEAKNRTVPAFLNVGGMNSEQIAKYIGISDKVAVLNAWYDAKEQQITNELCKQFNEKLWEAEDYIALTNVLITCVCINMTWRFNKAIGRRFLANINAAKDYVSEIGILKSLELVNKSFEGNLEFDDFDIEAFIQNCADIAAEGMVEGRGAN